MALSAVAWAGLGWWTASTALHWATAVLAGLRRPSADHLAAVNHVPADFSIIAPMSGAGDASAAYVQALKALADAGAEILICVASEDDQALTPLRAAWPEAPVLIGNDTTFNPKMNNVRKGLEAASRPLVALCDAGILLDAENLRRAALPLSDKVGLVLALKAGEAPGNFAAELERSYIDGQQARFLLAADRLGVTVASGGVTLISRETLQKDRQLARLQSLDRRRLFRHAFGARARPRDDPGRLHGAPAARAARVARRVAPPGALGPHEIASAGMAAGPVGAFCRLAARRRYGNGGADRRRSGIGNRRDGRARAHAALADGGKVVHVPAPADFRMARGSRDPRSRRSCAGPDGKRTEQSRDHVAGHRSRRAMAERYGAQGRGCSAGWDRIDRRGFIPGTSRSSICPTASIQRPPRPSSNRSSARSCRVHG